jgi:transcriptional regulator with XRE-family HTH domain
VRVLRAQDEIAVQVGRRIHDRRLALHVTTHALQWRTGIPRYLIRYYEAGRVVATLHTLRRLAVALDCEVVDFLGDREGKEEARAARRHESARIKG